MDDKLIERVEALLFASGKPLGVDFLSDILEEKSKKKVLNSLRKLKESYEQRKSPLMIVEQDNLWKLTVREEYLPLVRKIVAETELPKSVLETLAVIAWKSPVLQSNVVKVRTNKAYEHIDQLEKLGFIRRKKQGRSFSISLAEKFFEYFDVMHGDIRKMFSDVSGVEKELEGEQKKHETSEPEIKRDFEDEESNQEESDKNSIVKAIDAEKPHLGNLEVVDSIADVAQEGLEVVDIVEDGKGHKDRDDT
ncbi:MAG: SMC-Scp complex subunit ScpB, partial [Nanoarchaeota archaeon]